MTPINSPTQELRAVLRSDPYRRTKVLFMGAAFFVLFLSVSLWFGGAREEGMFVGLWVPAIHSLGTLLLVGERSAVPARAAVFHQEGARS